MIRAVSPLTQRSKDPAVTTPTYFPLDHTPVTLTGLYLPDIELSIRTGDQQKVLVQPPVDGCHRTGVAGCNQETFLLRGGKNGYRVIFCYGAHTCLQPRLQQQRHMKLHPHTPWERTDIDVGWTADDVLDFTSMYSKGVHEHTGVQAPQLHREICPSRKHIVLAVRLALGTWVQEKGHRATMTL